MSITLSDQIEKIEDRIDEIERKKDERFKKALTGFYQGSKESEVWAMNYAESQRVRQRELRESWRKRFGCECELHGFTCTHEKQGE